MSLSDSELDVSNVTLEFGPTLSMYSTDTTAGPKSQDKKMLKMRLLTSDLGAERHWTDFSKVQHAQQFPF